MANAGKPERLAPSKSHVWVGVAAAFLLPTLFLFGFLQVDRPQPSGDAAAKAYATVMALGLGVVLWAALQRHAAPAATVGGLASGLLVAVLLTLVATDYTTNRVCNTDHDWLGSWRDCTATPGGAPALVFLWIVLLVGAALGSLLARLWGLNGPHNATVFVSMCIGMAYAAAAGVLWMTLRWELPKAAQSNLVRETETHSTPGLGAAAILCALLLAALARRSRGER